MYELDEEQFNAAVDLIKTQLAPHVGEWWVDYSKQIQSYANKDTTIGTTWPLQVNLLKADNHPVESVKPKEGATGGPTPGWCPRRPRTRTACTSG